MKKLLAIILSIILVISIVPVGAITASAAAVEVVPEGYTAVRTVLDLYKVRYNLAGNYILMNDIDLTEATAVGGDYDYGGRGWNPIGSNDTYSKNGEFTGVFDGNGHIISGMRIYSYATLPSGTGTNIYLGLFANNVGTIKNLHVNGNITSYSSRYVYASGISAYNSGTIISCSNEVAIKIQNSTSDGCAGGIAAYNVGTIKKSYNKANIVVSDDFDGDRYAGGISGNGVENSLIENCYNLGGVTAETSYCMYGNSRLTGYAYAGGIQGYSSKANVENCYNVGMVSATAYYSYKATKAAITNKTVSNCYYLSNTGDDCTGATQLGEPLLKDSSVLTGLDFETIWTMGGDPDYEYPELQCFALSGKLGIKGNVAYLSTVEPDLSTIKRTDDTFTYEWFVDGQSVSTESVYNFSKTDIWKKVKLKVTGTKEFNKGTLYSEEFTVTKAVQNELAQLTELVYSDDNTIEVETLSNQDYSIDKTNWQKSGCFENLEPNKEYIIYSRISENDEYLAGKPVEILKVTTDRRPLTGSINIVGTTAFGDTLTADVSTVGPDEKVTYRYEWKRGDEVVGTNKTYTIVKEDIDKTLTLYVIGTDDYIGTLSSAPVTATKASVQVPSAPIVETKTNTIVKLVAKNGLEYSKDKINWQDSSLFEGLSAATEYTFYQRVKETETEFASKSSNGTKSTTLKNTISAPAKPVIKDVTNNSVTLEMISGYEYSFDGITWQNNNVFTGLLPNTEYSFCQRIAETETDYASATSGYITVVTLKNTVNKPVAPVVESATDSTVTLVAVSGYEYSKNGTNWQKSNVFTGLEALETYAFYQRVAETETDYASEKSVGTEFKVKFVASKPSAPVLLEVTNDKIVVQTQEGYQYSIDGISWRKQGMFTGLNPNTTYTVYCRMPENDTYYASETSSGLNVTTLKNSVNTPGAPIVLTKTDVTVTLVNTAGYEYSNNGTEWQNSNVFTGLSPDTEYTFYQRVAETKSDYASERSVGTTVKTYKKCEIDPLYHIYTSDCDSSCNECGFVRQVSDHVYDNDCDNTCNVENCGFIRTVGDHVYDNACDTTCNICSAVRTVGPHIYTNDCDTTCNICDTTRSISHKFTKETIVKATTSKNGYILTECSVCGVDESKTTIYYAKTFKLSTTSYAYNGKEKSPTVTVKDSAGKTLKKNVDYTVTYASGRKNVGTYKVVVKMKGKYSGSKTLTFTIKPTTKTSAELLVGATKSIGAKSNKSITYKSSDKKVATVSSKGVITAKKAGTATISVTSNKVTQKITVTVKTPYVKISGTNSMLLKKSVTLKATSNTSAKVTWSSSNKSVAIVSSSGKVTGHKAGTATIYAKITYKGKTYTGKYSITVKNPTIKLNKTSLTIYVGDTFKLKATTSPNVTVKFKSSNEKVATVSSSGKITPKAKGKTTITAYFTYGGKTYSKTCKVTVKKSNFRTLKNHILSEGTVDYDGYKMIGFKDERNETVYTTTIKYNSDKDCFVFDVTASGGSFMDMYFELRENQKYINVTMTIDLGVMASADIEYDLKVSEYYKGKSFTYHITTTGLLDPDEYNELVGSYNNVGFSGWQLLLFSELGLGFEDLGFTNY